MKSFMSAALVLLTGSVVAEEPVEAAPAVETAPAEEASPTATWTLEQKVAYAIGYQMPTQVPPDIDLTIVMQGLQDTLNGVAPAVSQEEGMAAFQEYGQKRQAAQRAEQEKMMAEAAQAGEGNRAKGAEYLAAKAKEEGVMATESGILYEVITPAEGAKPVATSQVKVHYSGKTIDGNEFDSSYKRGEPTQFGLNQVIRGWTEGLQLMSVGSKYRLHIPPDLAYGDNAPASIGPGQVLVFEVELIEIVQ